MGHLCAPCTVAIGRAGAANAIDGSVAHLCLICSRRAGGRTLRADSVIANSALCSLVRFTRAWRSTGSGSDAVAEAVGRARRTHSVRGLGARSGLELGAEARCSARATHSVSISCARHDRIISRATHCAVCALGVGGASAVC